MTAPIVPQETVEAEISTEAPGDDEAPVDPGDTQAPPPPPPPPSTEAPPPATEAAAAGHRPGAAAARHLSRA